MARNLILAVCIFCCGIYAAYQRYIPPLKAEIETYKAQIAEQEIQIALYKSQTESAEQALEKEKAKPQKIVTETKTKTEIAYVPKETIIYKDSVTGETITGKEPIDADLMVHAPRIGVRYNGKVFDLAGISGENAKFEGGKIVGESWTTATLDVTKLVDREVMYRLSEQEKDFSVGGYLTNKGFVGSLGLVCGSREYKILAKVPKFREFYGAGMEVKF